MKWALLNKVRVEPKPQLRATCPVCQTEVRAKCGKINIWHWAHKTCDCDPWYESETAWHKNWKDLFPADFQEVVIGRHRADIQTPELIIELQHSSISVDEIRQREEFYKKMIWVFDVRRSEHNISIHGSSFNWSRARRTLLHCQAPVFLHLGRNKLYNVTSWLNGVAGYCQKIERDDFLALAGHPDYLKIRPPTIYSMDLSAFESRSAEIENRQSLIIDDPF